MFKSESNTPVLHYANKTGFFLAAYVTAKSAMEKLSAPIAHALSWIDAWNSHDLEEILSHYSDDVVFQTATVVRRWNKPDGILRGKAELREHFKRGLDLVPDLRFEFEEIFCCPGGYAVLYRRNNGNHVIDVVELDKNQLIRHARAFYAEEQK